MNIAVSRVAVAAALLFTALPAAAQEADLVLRNGIIWTVDDSNPRAEALASLRDRIVYVGSNAGVERYIGPGTRVIDLGGKLVTPGFYDNHVHFEGTGRLLYGLNLLDVSDEPAFVARITEVDERYAPGTWITGGDWSAYEAWGEGEVAEAGREVNPDDLYGDFFLPQRRMIDRITADRPVLVRRFDRKVYLANGAALELAGIRKGTPDPEGIAVQRDASGEPTGALFNPVSGAVESTVLVRDNVRTLFDPLIPEPSREQRIQETLRAWQQMREVGVTSYCDITSAPVQVDIYRELRDKGQMTARVRYRPPLDRWESLANLGIQPGFGDDWIRFGAVKAWIDGIMGNSSARFYEPYTHNPSSRGIWRDIMFPFERSPENPEDMQSRLERLALEADAAGIQLTVHAIGDEANGYLMDMLERIIAKNGERDRRFRLVHAQVMTDRDIERAGKMKIVAEVQPFHTSDDMRWMEERIGRDRSRGAYAFRRLWDSGATVSFGSDSPGTNASRYYLNPMLGLYAAVTRKTLSGQPEGGWFPREKLTIEEAIKAYTLNTAYAGYEENIKGSITAGKLADFVILSDNLLTMNPDGIKDVRVLMTIVGGRIVHEAD
ncbi:MAG: amidohydrolase [Gammaproteobacteria bacterium]|nr:amidohydrolase [Gammaproteobacteria bacterium]MDH4254034.1 amidohydrolase [Gammaproteobacteria bacterium]MDH5310333.1 amidohydrolase [Gammaproteobacteria bacterium]